MAKSISDLNKMLNVGNKLTLYHNSKGGFKGVPLVNYGRSTCDFGSGLYLSTDVLRVSNIGRRSRTVCYKTNVCLDKLKVYTFDNIYLFYLYCITNRMGTIGNIPDNVKTFIDKVNSYDIVIGETLDGYDVYGVLNSFVYGSTRLSDITNKLKLSVLGLQYCIKSQSLLNTLQFRVTSSNDITVDKEEEGCRFLLTQKVDDLTFSDLIIKVKELI